MPGQWAKNAGERLGVNRRNPCLLFSAGPAADRITLRHSLSNWLVNKAKVEPKTVQGIPRHSRIQTTLDLYTQEDSDEAWSAQGEFLQALGMRSELVQ